MKNHYKVLILLAAHNGSDYVSEQIESILVQDYQEWHLVLSDDGNGTTAILKSYAEAYPHKITFHQSNRRFGSAKSHFMYLLMTFHEYADYFMFCDQDDIWHKDKIRLTLSKMQETEQYQSIPVLVHTDLAVVDNNRVLLDASFQHYSGIFGGNVSFKDLLIKNVVTGCTVLINASLAELVCSKPIPSESIIMHDWFIALVAAAFGKIAFINSATIEYRQHTLNTLGAKRTKSLKYIYDRVIKNKDLKKAFMDIVKQAETIDRFYGEQINQNDEKILKVVSKLPNYCKLKRIYVFFRYCLWKNSLVMKIGQILFW